MSAEADAFLRTVLRSGLFEREQLQATLRAAPPAARAAPRQLADHLISQGQLTPFQAQKLLQGISVGLVTGPYQLQAVLGRGGMGSVYLAMDTRTKAHVALKVLPPKRARDEERQLARFLREKDLTQKVQHPNLALTLEVGESAGIHYIAMEYIPGQTLYRLVVKDGTLPVPRAARLFAEVAAALAAGHERGVIHRDVKPSNIMVTPHDHAKVLDLGLAFTTGEVVEDVEVVGGKGYVVGSIDYMAPEQTRDATQIDGRADIYALGCCLYFALTGKPPFPSGTMREKVQAHRHQEPEPVRARNPAVSEGFAQVVHRMLAKDPDRRHADATVLAAELRQWGGPLAVKALEKAGDVDYQKAVQDVVAAIPVAEAVDDSVDAFIFHSEADSGHTATPLPLEPDPWYRYLWLIAIGLGLFWLFATFVVLAALLIRFILA
jgi:serine/threonine protein kinase